MAADELCQLLVQKLTLNDEISSVAIATELDVDHQKIVGAVKSLQSMNLIEANQVECKRLVLSAEGKQIVANGSHEYLLWSAVPAESTGIEQQALMKSITDPNVAKLGFTKAMSNKWIAIDKSSGKPTVCRKVKDVVDEVRQLLQLVQSNSADQVISDI